MEAFRKRGAGVTESLLRSERGEDPACDWLAGESHHPLVWL
jgi:hypothetical protein